MKKILVAVDGSTHAEKALAITASLAKQENASVIVLHVTSNKDMSREMQEGIEIEYGSEITKRLKAIEFRPPLPDQSQYARTMITHGQDVSRIVKTLAGENIIKRAMARLHENDVESVESYLVNGDPDDQIIEACKKHDVDTIVMGCRGTGKLRGLVMGSVSQSVAHRADCSVIIVK